MSNKNFVAVIVILAVVGVIGMSAYLPARRASEKEAQMQDFPGKIGEWEVADLPLSKQDYEILETKNLIMREYKNAASQDMVYLYIVYSAGDRKVVHPPEICYSGGGATIIEKSVIPLTDTIKANEFTMEDKDSRQLVVYWFKAGDLNTYSYFGQQLKVVLSRMLKNRSSGALIRVSTPIKEGNQKDAALNLLKSFCRQVEPLLPRYVP